LEWSSYSYEVEGFWDEVLDASGTPRAAAALMWRFLDGLGPAALRERQEDAEHAIRDLGITFAVYGEGGNIDRPWPMDVVPRIIDLAEWRTLEEGLTQRLQALNLFIDDVYDEQRCIADGIIPRDLLAGSTNYREQCVGMKPPLGVWAHICGSDLVRGDDGTVYVLEDNLRVPSGVSYMIENRLVSKRVFPDLFREYSIEPVDDYPNALLDMLASLSPRPDDESMIVLLTPGIYNSAYFEHAFLAQRMGIPLVEGRDLVVEDDVVKVRTIEGLQRVDVIYRRIDDQFLDPTEMRPDSMLGTAGLMRAWRAGNVAIANAPGSGVADDKVVYAYVPEMIRYYLAEEPIIANVPTYLCFRDDDQRYVLDHLDDLVVKPANESGGYGIFIGPRASRAEREEVAARVVANPRDFVAQPTLTLSTAPTLSQGRLAPRHLDLRPFVLSGERSYVTRGGLTRVALREGSLIVNSSQGGGSKDTWVVDLDNPPPPAIDDEDL
jgi:uncharacterized circularly permuted ATP-grasp superfamily protein